ncbi:DEAD/DEAH box helicase [uncultured Sphaerochaeta sp.]|uniref:DEAD/DEAH box helicase n=1 Tax=uncultured Sphaerochaeta sp. TaxID=886478 RepID=UPI00260A8744|nr:DEAD/DEAH box helicase [uncultured Sphaerochaeta sp.]
MSFSLYAWQGDCIESWLGNQGRGIVQVVTGAGKTILALYAAKELQQQLNKKLHIVVIVPKTFLVGQWKASILSHQKDLGLTRDDIGWVHGNHHQAHNKPVMIYVVNSARYTLANILQQKLQQHEPVLLIADECHHYASEENHKIFSFLDKLPEADKKHYHALGLSATPQVNGFETRLVPALGPLFYTYGFNEAMQQGVINQAVIHNIELSMTEEQKFLYAELTARISSTSHRLRNLVPDLKKLKGLAFFYAIEDLCTSKNETIADLARLLVSLYHQRRAIINLAPQRLDCVFDLISLLDHTSKIIIFGERISQSEELYERLKRRYPKEVVHYHSEMGDVERTLALEQYRSGEARILVSCKALDEGLDIPAADVGIILSSTSEQRQRVQRMGRVLRRQEGKHKASLFYLSLADTVEDANLLEEGIEMVQEGYLSYTDHFIHPVYDELADTLTEAVQKSKKPIPGLHALLDQGRVRNDWYEDPAVLQAWKNQETSPVKRRYYSCMRTLALLREKS